MMYSREAVGSVSIFQRLELGDIFLLEGTHYYFLAIGKYCTIGIRSVLRTES